MHRQFVSSSRFGGFAVLAFLASLALFQTGCAEIAGTGEQVAIPPVYINCTSAQCRTNRTPKQITVMITTSGCASADYGALTSGSSTTITCNATSGCYGQITNWEKETIPTGTYSLCGRIDHDQFYPAPTGSYSYGALDNVAVAAITGNQMIEIWEDQ